MPSVCSAFQAFSTSLPVSLSIHRTGPSKTRLSALGGIQQQEAIAGGEQIGYTERAYSLELGRSTHSVSLTIPVLLLTRSGVLAHLWFAGREYDKEGHDTMPPDAPRCNDGRLADQRTRGCTTSDCFPPRHPGAQRHRRPSPHPLAPLN